MDRLHVQEYKEMHSREFKKISNSVLSFLSDLGGMYGMFCVYNACLFFP